MTRSNWSGAISMDEQILLKKDACEAGQEDTFILHMLVKDCMFRLTFVLHERDLLCECLYRGVKLVHRIFLFQW